MFDKLPIVTWVSGMFRTDPVVAATVTMVIVITLGFLACLVTLRQMER